MHSLLRKIGGWGQVQKEPKQGVRRGEMGRPSRAPSLMGAGEPAVRLAAAGSGGAGSTAAEQPGAIEAPEGLQGKKGRAHGEGWWRLRCRCFGVLGGVMGQSELVAPGRGEGHRVRGGPGVPHSETHMVHPLSRQVLPSGLELQVGRFALGDQGVPRKEKKNSRKNFLMEER